MLLSNTKRWFGFSRMMAKCKIQQGRGLRSLFLCENLCEKTFPKYAKTGKNRKKSGNLKPNEFSILMKFEEVSKLAGLDSNEFFGCGVQIGTNNIFDIILNNLLTRQIKRSS